MMSISSLNSLDMVACQSYDAFYKNATRICGITTSEIQKLKYTNKHMNEYMYIVKIDLP